MRKLLLTGQMMMTILPFIGQQWWQQSANSFNDFNEVYATSNGKALTYGDSTDIFGGFAYGSQYLTTNQGATWNFQNMGSPVYRTREAYFFDDNNGFLVGRNQLSGNGFILKTIDGGVTWTEGVPHVEKLEGVSFANNSTGYAAGRNDYITRTTDGGNNWVDVSANTGNDLYDVFFTTPANGYVVGKSGSIAYTTDSANTWVNQNSNTGQDLNAAHFINDSTGWVVGKAGKILFTNDYGTTWTTQNSGTPEDLNDVEFVNDSTGWAVGKAGTVIKTADAGLTWVSETSGTPEDIMNITMRNAQLGWFCGKNGTLFVYAVVQPNAIAEHLKAENFNIAPNPFSESTTIYINSPISQNTTATIMDINGKIVKVIQLKEHQNQLTIQRESLNTGVYLLKISDNTSFTTLKMVIE